MFDAYERKIEYLRISLTDRCNLRCRYCMPQEGVPRRDHAEILSLEEIGEIVSAAAELGITKIRLTGGEPLVRRGVVELCGRLSAVPGIRELTLTTNGLLLPGMAKELKAAGVRRVNISLDTLDPEKYAWITRGGALEDALRGVRAALDAGLVPVKLNTVLIGGFNDGEIPALCALTETLKVELRFIELMPLGESRAFPPEAYLRAETVLEREPRLTRTAGDGGIAERYRLPGAAGSVGLIRGLDRAFCARCNRIRLTPDGHLKPCLHSAEEIALRGLHGEALRRAIAEAITRKPPDHGALSATARSRTERYMNQIGG